MKYKMLGSFTVLFFLTSLVSCNTATTVFTDTSLQEIPVSSRCVVKRLCYIYDASNLKELSNLSDYIVVGTLLDDAKQKLYYPDPNLNDTAIYGVTVSSFKISKVFKGNVKEGETIKIAETYYSQEMNGESVQYLLDYGPSEPNRDYFFFLNEETDKTNEFFYGYFSPSMREKARYPFLNRPLSAEITLQDIEGFTLVGVSEGKYLSLLEEVRAFLGVN